MLQPARDGALCPVETVPPELWQQIRHRRGDYDGDRAAADDGERGTRERGEKARLRGAELIRRGNVILESTAAPALYVVPVLQ